MKILFQTLLAAFVSVFLIGGVVLANTDSSYGEYDPDSVVEVTWGQSLWYDMGDESDSNHYTNATDTSTYIDWTADAIDSSASFTVDSFVNGSTDGTQLLIGSYEPFNGISLNLNNATIDGDIDYAYFASNGRVSFEQYLAGVRDGLYTGSDSWNYNSSNVRGVYWRGLSSYLQDLVSSEEVNTYSRLQEGDYGEYTLYFESPASWETLSVNGGDEMYYIALDLEGVYSVAPEIQVVQLIRDNVRVRFYHETHQSPENFDLSVDEIDFYDQDGNALNVDRIMNSYSAEDGEEIYWLDVSSNGGNVEEVYAEINKSGYLTLVSGHETYEADYTELRFSDVLQLNTQVVLEDWDGNILEPTDGEIYVVNQNGPSLCMKSLSSSGAYHGYFYCPVDWDGGDFQFQVNSVEGVEGYAPTLSDLEAVPSDTSVQATYTMEMDPAYMLSIEGPGATLISDATVLTGDNLDIACDYVSGGSYACLVPLDQQTGRVYVSSPSLFNDYETTLNSVRTSDSDAMVSENIVVPVVLNVEVSSQIGVPVDFMTANDITFIGPMGNNMLWDSFANNGDGSYAIGVLADYDSSFGFVFDYTVDIPGFFSASGQIDVEQTRDLAIEDLEYTYVAEAYNLAGDLIEIEAATDSNGNFECVVDAGLAYCPIDFSASNYYAGEILADGYVHLSHMMVNSNSQSTQFVDTIVMDYAYLAQLVNPTGNIVPNAMLSAGDQFGTVCDNLGSGMYGCATPLADTNRGVEMMGPNHPAQIAEFSVDRRDHMDAQVSEQLVIHEVCTDPYSHESNDTPADSTSMSLGGQEVGRICMGDADFYQVALDQGDTLRTVLAYNSSVLDGELMVTLYQDNGGNTLSQLDLSASGNGQEVIEYTVSTSGNYLVKVEGLGSSSENNYSLSVELNQSDVYVDNVYLSNRNLLFNYTTGNQGASVDTSLMDGSSAGLCHDINFVSVSTGNTELTYQRCTDDEGSFDSYAEANGVLDRNLWLYKVPGFMGLSDGAYYVEVEMDSNAVLDEVTLTNNTMQSSQFTIDSSYRALFPNLYADNLYLHRTHRNFYQFKYSLGNNGGVNVNQDYVTSGPYNGRGRTTVYLDGVEIEDHQWAVEAYGQRMYLQAGRYIEYNLWVDPSLIDVNTSHVIEVRVDSRNAISETDESDNSVTLSF